MKSKIKPLSLPDELPRKPDQITGPYYTSAGAIRSSEDPLPEKKPKRKRKGGLALALLMLFSLSLFAQKNSVRTDAGDITVEVLMENLEHPWGMSFLPDGRLLFTERAGTLKILEPEGKVSEALEGTPKVFNKGQGGMLDVALHPDYEENKVVYLSYAEPRGDNDSTATTALGKGVLASKRIEDFEVIFRMEPTIEGPNHFGGRIVFTDDGHLLLTLAERFQFDPAQDLSNTLGTIVRLNLDGSVPNDNPFIQDQQARDEIYSYGHRNIESAAIDPDTGLLWIAEMGPMGGDEFQQPKPGKNYGWPEVSWGNNYDGSEIPKPDTRSEFEDAVIKWTPTISPSGMIFYTGEMFPEWQGDALIGGLTSSGLVRVRVNGQDAKEMERIPLGARIRDVAEASDGSIYILTDEENGKILKLKTLE